MKAYLDWAATALPNPKAVEAAHQSYLNHFANPSAIYSIGEDVQNCLKSSRDRLAKILSCQVNQLYFCSSGTEANNIVISSYLTAQSPGSILVTAIEHDAVWKPIQNLKKMGWKIIEAPVPKTGIVDANEFCSLIQEDTYAVFLMAVCNENGAIQPIKEVSEQIAVINQSRSRKIRFHVDCVQALGKIPIHFDQIKADSASFSGHKIGAIRGSGLLFLRKELIPIYLGGGQEKGIRSGTENVGAIESLVVAAEEACRLQNEHFERAKALKTKLVNGIDALGLPVLPNHELKEALNCEHYSPYVLQFALPKLPTEVAIRIFNDNNVFVSGGSACSNNSREKLARVSKAVHLSEELQPSTLRVSIGFTTTEEEIDLFLQILKEKLLPLAKQF